MIYVKQKEVAMRLPLTVPELDNEQIASAKAMYRDKDKFLFSDPGAGKTLTALRAWEMTGFQRCIVVCPSIAVRNWAVWAVAYADQRCDERVKVQILTANADEILDNVDMVICTYGTIGRKKAALLPKLKKYKPRVLICDESDNLNGDGSQRTAAILGDDGLYEYASWMWMLTGTPIPRYQDGLYPALSALFPDRLTEFRVGSKTRFLDRFTRQKLVKYGHMRFPVKKVMGSKNTGAMNDLLYGGDKPIAIRNKLKIRSVPMHRELTLDFSPSKELLDLQDEVTTHDGAFVSVDDYGNPISEVNPKLNQALHLYGKETAPLVASSVIDLIHKVEGGILVLYWHTEVGRILKNTIDNKSVAACLISGATSQMRRDSFVDMFNSGFVKVMVGQIKAMGVALNLQENCNTVVFAEDTYSNAMNLQAYQRVWRRGQDKNVDIIWCKTLQPLADLRSKVADRKRKSAKEALD